MFDIKIIKLRIVYSLPLCVFSSLYQPQRVQPLLPIYTYFKKMSQVNNFYRGNMQQSRINFCNWHSFMSNTTPVMYESEELLIKDIFNSLINPSLFGIDCLYKIDQSHYTKVKYFPTLNPKFVLSQGRNFTLFFTISFLYISISTKERPHYITSSCTYQFYFNIFCIVLKKKLHSAIRKPAFIALVCIIF